MVGDREHVVARALVVRGQRLGLELAVRSRRVSVERAAQPFALDREGIGAIGAIPVKTLQPPLIRRTRRRTLALHISIGEVSHGAAWEIDEILERALQEDDLDGMDSTIARLVAEERISRSAMLRRSFAAAAGLTILAPRPRSRGREQRRRRRAAPAPTTKRFSRRPRGGQLNTIALPPDWANSGEIMGTFKKRFGLKITNANPNGSSAEENTAVRTLKNDSRAPDVLDVGPAFAIAGARKVCTRPTATASGAASPTR